jgi:hypothetical protein
LSRHGSRIEFASKPTTRTFYFVRLNTISARPPEPGDGLTILSSSPPMRHEGEVITYDGATYQALHDTGEPPENEAHWICLAAPGRDAKSFRHRGTFKDDAEYASHDIVALNGGSFLALHDKPGLCPGPGWQLLCAQGKRGATGEPGPRGPIGVAGPPGHDAGIGD